MRGAIHTREKARMIVVLVSSSRQHAEEEEEEEEEEDDAVRLLTRATQYKPQPTCHLSLDFTLPTQYR